MFEPYIRKEDDLTIIELVNHLVMIEEREPVKISICDLEINSNITLTKNEIFEISQFVKASDTCQKLVMDNILIEVRPDWLTITIDNNLVAIRPEMFDKIIKYFEDRERIMKESNVTQEIFNRLENTNISQNTSSCEKSTKPTTPKTMQANNNKSIYDTIIDTLKTKGGNNNEK